MPCHKIKEVVRNDRVERRYIAYTAKGKIHIRVHELMDGETVKDDTLSFPIADDGVTVAHSGMTWEEHARKRFTAINNARFTHEFQDLRGSV